MVIFIKIIISLIIGDYEMSVVVDGKKIGKFKTYLTMLGDKVAVYLTDFKPIPGIVNEAIRDNGDITIPIEKIGKIKKSSIDGVYLCSLPEPLSIKDFLTVAEEAQKMAGAIEASKGYSKKQEKSES
jgi:hypothetical protein